MSLVVLVPVARTVEPACDDGLRELERRGHPVWKLRGISQVDRARSQLATDALARGFTELLWVDSDVVFHPDDVDRLRAHDQPFVCGLYPKKGPREFAAAFLPGTTSLTFGAGGGLVPVAACGFGFVLTRREVFDRVRDGLGLPTTNRRSGRPLVPYFAPLLAGDGDDAVYLGEDYSFCERARRVGFEVLADTAVRLGHVGEYTYYWEDAGRDRPRYDPYTFHLAARPPAADPGAG